MDKWDTRFIALAALTASWSKDPSTKVGAVIDKDRQVLSQGFNGFPRGVKDTKERYENREEKYRLVVHAEMNALLNALYNGTSVKGGTLYVVNLPVCHECAKAIIQAGIKTVIMQAGMNERWVKSWEVTKKMFDEAGVEYKFV